MEQLRKEAVPSTMKKHAQKWRSEANSAVQNSRFQITLTGFLYQRLMHNLSETKRYYKGSNINSNSGKKS